MESKIYSAAGDSLELTSYIALTLWCCEAIGQFPKKWFHVRYHAD
jgi:hypothetical protein